MRHRARSGSSVASSVFALPSKPVRAGHGERRASEVPRRNGQVIQIGRRMVKGDLMTDDQGPVKRRACTSKVWRPVVSLPKVNRASGSPASWIHRGSGSGSGARCGGRTVEIRDARRDRIRGGIPDRLRPSSNRPPWWKRPREKHPVRAWETSGRPVGSSGNRKIAPNPDRAVAVGEVASAVDAFPGEAVVSIEEQPTAFFGIGRIGNGQTMVSTSP